MNQNFWVTWSMFYFLFFYIHSILSYKFIYLPNQNTLIDFTLFFASTYDTKKLKAKESELTLLLFLLITSHCISFYQQLVYLLSKKGAHFNRSFHF